MFAFDVMAAMFEVQHKRICYYFVGSSQRGRLTLFAISREINCKPRIANQNRSRYWPNLYQRRIISVDELGQERVRPIIPLRVNASKQTDDPSRRITYIVLLHVQTNLLAYFILTDDPSVCINSA